MQRQDDPAPVGIRLVTDERPDVLAECLRVARRLIHSGAKVVGLLPASREIGVHSVGAQLSVALSEIIGGTVAFVDANVRWPAMPGMISPDGAPADSGYRTRWISDSVGLLFAPSSGQAGAGVPQLATLIRESSEIFSHFVVDLTGFKPFGEHLAAVEMMDGIVVIGRVGVTREAQLRTLGLEFGKSKLLGVLLIGGGQE